MKYIILCIFFATFSVLASFETKNGSTTYVPIKNFDNFQFESDLAKQNTMKDRQLGKNILLYSKGAVDNKKFIEKVDFDLNFLTHFLQAKSVECVGALCEVIKYRDENKVSFKIYVQSLDKYNGQMGSSLAHLKNQENTKVYLIYGFDWSHIFVETKTVLIFSEQNSTTFVQSYFWGAIKQKTLTYFKLIPWVDLEKSTLEAIRSEFNTFILWLKNSNREPQSEASVFLDKYKQNHYQIDDPEGDFELFRRLKRAGYRLVSYFIPLNLPPLDSVRPDDWMVTQTDVSNKILSNPTSSATIQGRENPIDIKKLFVALNKIMTEEFLNNNILPTHSKIHNWSPEFRSKNPTSFFSKLLVALALGVTWRFMTTEKEKDLHTWLLLQPPNSVTLHEIYRTSYRLNSGDIYLSILTIQNLLSALWRLPDRESLPFVSHLKPITSGYNYDKDRFGTWYHFWGMVLYGYSKGNLLSMLIGKAEATGSNILYQTDKTQKQWVNYIGGDLGSLLKETQFESLDLTSNDINRVINEDYIIKTEDFRDRLPFSETPEIQATLDPGAFGSDFKSISIKVENDYSQCELTLIPRFGNSWSTQFQTKKYVQDIKSQKSLQIQMGNFLSELNLRGARLFLNCRDIELRTLVK